MAAANKLLLEKFAQRQPGGASTNHGWLAENLSRQRRAEKHRSAQRLAAFGRPLTCKRQASPHRWSPHDHRAYCRTVGEFPVETKHAVPPTLFRHQNAGKWAYTCGADQPGVGEIGAIFGVAILNVLHACRKIERTLVVCELTSAVQHLHSVWRQVVQCPSLVCQQAGVTVDRGC